ncbi:hypothetical protein [Bacteroides sp.]
MPSYWQSFVNTIAQLCQHSGTALLAWWHNFANAVAKNGKFWA